MLKTQKTVFLILLFIFLFLGTEALAAACNKPPAWNGAGSCTFDVYYEDPSGGSNLAGCYYNIQSGASPTCPSDGTWNSACACSGLANTTCSVNVSIGPVGNCNVSGAGTCKVCSKATDEAGNIGYGEQALNIDFAAPSVSVTGAPVSWQNTDATANVSCSDAYSGCDSATYRLKTYTSNPGSCSTNYADYTLTVPQTISSHLWVCGAAKDNVGNAGFSTPVEFKVDKEKPVSQITAPDDGSTQTADFNVTVSDTDTGGSGINTGACYYRTYDSGVGWTRNWTLRTCNSTQLITVGAGKDCQTKDGTCTAYVYSYDNAGNQSDTNLRSFLIKIDITSPTTTIKVKRKSTGEDLTAASSWLRADTYTIQFEDHDQADGSGLNCEKCSCEYSIYSCDVGGTNCNNVVVPLTSQIPNFSFDIVAGKTVSIYNLEGIGRYRIYRGVKNKANKSAYKYQYINFDFTPPRTEIR